MYTQSIQFPFPFPPPLALRTNRIGNKILNFFPLRKKKDCSKKKEYRVGERREGIPNIYPPLPSFLSFSVSHKLLRKRSRFFFPPKNLRAFLSQKKNLEISASSPLLLGLKRVGKRREGDSHPSKIQLTDKEGVLLACSDGGGVVSK